MARSPLILVTRSDRVLVLGASGWLGRTFMSQLPGSTAVLPIGGVATPMGRWSEESVAEFAPTVVANFAFLTPRRMQEVGPEVFERVNSNLIGRFVFAASRPSVRAAITVSSGAAVPSPGVDGDPAHDLYGRLKAQEEGMALGMVRASTSVVVARAYSLSGGLVRRPSEYAFSDFILQAPTGTIKVAAQMPVWRRYSAATDFLFVASSLALRGWSGVVESGGPLVELGQLADLVVEIVNPAAVIERALDATLDAHVYASDDSSWSQACTDLCHTPQTLADQVSIAAATLLAPQ